MIDPLADRAPSTAGPAAVILPVTLSDAADLLQVPAALYVETGGALASSPRAARPASWW